MLRSVGAMAGWGGNDKIEAFYPTAREDADDASPKAVQVHLGHSSITVTMDRYTHLFPSDIDALVRRIDDIRARNLAAQTRPNDPTRGIEIGGR